MGGSHELIANLRKRSPGAVYGESTAPPVLAQLISSMSIILGEQAGLPSSARSSALETTTISRNRLDGGGVGTERLRRLAFNSRYLRLSLKAMGFIVFGHRDSPIVPLLIYQPGKLATFSRLMLERHMIVVVVVVSSSLSSPPVCTLTCTTTTGLPGDVVTGSASTILRFRRAYKGRFGPASDRLRRRRLCARFTTLQGTASERARGHQRTDSARGGRLLRRYTTIGFLFVSVIIHVFIRPSSLPLRTNRERDWRAKDRRGLTSRRSPLRASESGTHARTLRNSNEFLWRKTAHRHFFCAKSVESGFALLLVPLHSNSIHVSVGDSYNSHQSRFQSHAASPLHSCCFTANRAASRPSFSLLDRSSARPVTMGPKAARPRVKQWISREESESEGELSESSAGGDDDYEYRNTARVKPIAARQAVNSARTSRSRSVRSSGNLGTPSDLYPSSPSTVASGVLSTVASTVTSPLLTLDAKLKSPFSNLTVAGRKSFIRSAIAFVDASTVNRKAWWPVDCRFVDPALLTKEGSLPNSL